MKHFRHLFSNWHQQAYKKDNKTKKITERERDFFHTPFCLKNTRLQLEKYNRRSKATQTEGLVMSFVLNYPQKEHPLSNSLMKTAP